MQTPKAAFALRLKDAMLAAGYAPKPSVLEREFNLRHWGKPMTLHGVRRWLRGETLPDYSKLQTLATWLQVPIETLTFGSPRLALAKPQIKHIGLGYQDEELFAAFSRLPAPRKKLLRDMILVIVKLEAYETEQEKPN